MDMEIKNKIDLMVENFEVLRLRFMADSKFLNHFSALVHANNEKKVNIEILKRIRASMKEDTGVFSFFRGVNEAILMNFLYFEEDYDVVIKNTLTVYEKMKNNGVSRSNYIPLAAYTIAKEAPYDKYDYIINRMKEFYKIIKKGNFFTTNAKDYIFLASLAITDLEIEKACRNVQYNYNTLKNIGLPKGTQLQFLSYIMTILGEKSEQALEKIINICGEFKVRKLKLGSYVIPSLGVLLLVNGDFSVIAQNIKEANEYLKTKKGYGFLRLSNDMRMLLVVSIICHAYLEKEKSNTDSIHNFVLAQQLSILSAACSINIAATPANS